MKLLKRISNIWKLGEIGPERVQPLIENAEKLKESPKQAVIIKMKTPVKEFLEKNPPQNE